MKTYAVMFNSAADAAKLVEFLRVARIPYTKFETVDETFMDTYTSMFNALKEAYLPSIALERELTQALKAFHQNPNPALSTVIKSLRGKVKRAKLKEQKNVNKANA